MIKIINFILIFAIIFVFIFSIMCKKKENFTSYNLPKTIYLYWHDDKNLLIQENINCWKRNISSDWTVEFITNLNLENYVSTVFIEKYKRLDPTKFSDFLRLELIYNNGGVWMDAFTLIADGTFLNKYYEEMQKSSYDITLYNFDQKNAKNTIYLENWFIMAPQYSTLIHDLRTEFDKSYSMGFLNYKKTILIPSGVNMKNTIGYGDAVYLMQHAIINYLIHTGNKYNINIKNANIDMFKLQIMLKWNHSDTANYILYKNWKTITPAIKLTKNTRYYFAGKEQKFIDMIKNL